MQQQAIDAVNRKEVVLLAQRPGFGKTWLMLQLCTQRRFVVVLAPTKALQTQILRDLQLKKLPCASLHEVLKQVQGV